MPFTLNVVLHLEPTLLALLQARVQPTDTDEMLKRLERKVDTIIMNEQKVIESLAKIDSATTRIGSNVQVVADGLQTVSGEVDALQEALKNAGVSQSLVDQAAAIGNRVQAASDALDAQVPVLTAIASKGHTGDPVPVAPPLAPETI
jgi:methylaspartate ammonia-lyase